MDLLTVGLVDECSTHCGTCCTQIFIPTYETAAKKLTNFALSRVRTSHFVNIVHTYLTANSLDEYIRFKPEEAETFL